MTIWYKQGVLGDLRPMAQKGLGRIGKFAESEGKELQITSIREGNHSCGSLHYIGLAFDFRPFGMTIGAYKRELGFGWDVIDEGNHIHCEYDPKGLGGVGVIQ